MRHCTRLLIGLTLILTACHGRRPLPTVGDSHNGDSRNACYTFKSVSYPKCSWDLSDGRKSFAMSGNLYIRPDSIVYFRGVMIVEVFRGIIKQDSFLVINRMDRVCYRGSNRYLSRKLGLPVNPQMLYLLLTADVCASRYAEQGFKTVRKTEKIHLSSPTARLDMRLSDERLTSVDFSGMTTGRCTYDAYRESKPYTMPMHIALTTTHKGQESSIAITMHDVQFDRPQAFNLHVPSSYKMIELK